MSLTMRQLFMEERAERSESADISLQAALEVMVNSGSGEVREDGEWFAELSDLRYDLKRQGKNLLLHLWSGERNLTRQIVEVGEQSSERIDLKVQRFGRSKPGRLEFLRRDFRRSAARITREDFRARLGRFLQERFPDATFEGLSSAPDLEHSFSGVYVRGRMRDGGRTWALLAASTGENATAIEGMLAFGILWLDWTRNHAERHSVEGLRLFVPERTSRVLRERALALSTAARAEVFEYSESEGRIQKMDLADAGNLESRLVQRRSVEAALSGSQNAFVKILALAPGQAQPNDTTGAIARRISAGRGEVAFCFRGLEFARYSPLDGLFFGLGHARRRLNTDSEPTAAKLLRRLDLHRNSLASETKHSLYRAAPERCWRR
jgi:hypothetical protein